MVQPQREIRAIFDDTTITVYQAYSPAIADAALAAGTFVEPFKRGRMTWIKPSFLWMMYRSGWGTKPGQERILSIRITRQGFESALADSCLSHFDERTYSTHEEWLERKAAAPVRVQWDPERNRVGDAMPWRSLQVGLGGTTVDLYVDSWIVDLTDISGRVAELSDGEVDDPALPIETPYPLPPQLAGMIGATQRTS